jgi:molecular chaperone DnaK
VQVCRQPQNRSLGDGPLLREKIAVQDIPFQDQHRLYAAEDRQRKQTQQTRDAAESLLNQARKTRKKLKDEDRSRLDASIAELEDALKDGNEQRIRTASEDIDRILRSVGTYTSAPEGGNDDGAYDA